MSRISYNDIANAFGISVQEVKTRLMAGSCIGCGNAHAPLTLFHYRPDSIYSVSACSGCYREHMNDAICDRDPLWLAEADDQE